MLIKNNYRMSYEMASLVRDVAYITNMVEDAEVCDIMTELYDNDPEYDSVTDDADTMAIAETIKDKEDVSREYEIERIIDDPENVTLDSFIDEEELLRRE